MPVGQAVIATIDTALAGSGATTGAAAGAGFTTPSTSATTSSTLAASRSDATKSLRTSARARLESSFMCSAPPDSGAAIRNTRSAGPSGRRSQPWGQPGEADRRGVDVGRAAVRNRDPARQTGGRLRFAGHRSTHQTRGVTGPARLGERTDQTGDDGFLVTARVDVEQDEIGGDDRLSHGDTFMGWVRTASRSSWAGVGRADPGSAAAALP